MTWNQISFLESDGQPHPGVGSNVVVGITVVVDITEVAGVASVSRDQPPVVAATMQNITTIFYFLFTSFDLYLQPFNKRSSYSRRIPISATCFSIRNRFWYPELPGSLCSMSHHTSCTAP